MKRAFRRLTILAGISTLAACKGVIPEANPSVSTPPIVAAPTSAALMGAVAVPASSLSGIDSTDAASALASFRESCRVVVRREDRSGLTQPADWQEVCSVANASGVDPRRFFLDNFQPVRVGTGEAFATGYFEPAIAGCRVRHAGCETPVYAMPPELVRAWPDDVPESEREGQPPLGRYAADGRFVPYYERAEIEAGALAGRGLEIAYAVDPIELFFLQIQGSGRIRLPDGTYIRVGYRGANGHPYRSIGVELVQRGVYQPHQVSAEVIKNWVRRNPADGRELLFHNPSYVFFREVSKVPAERGPLGAMNRSVTPMRSSTR